MSNISIEYLSFNSLCPLAITISEQKAEESICM